MSAQTPTFVETPEPPSEPDTPSEMPGTPNSTTTSLSALSTTAIKDGHRGAPHPSSTHPFYGASALNPSTLEAERADRISRLAGLERVSTLRPNSNTQATTPGGTYQGSGTANPNPNANPNQTGFVNQIPGYFDALGNPVYTTKMSTVGSASATGSLGGADSRDGFPERSHRTTTWASGSTGEGTGEDTDMMSMDTPSHYREQEQDNFHPEDRDDEGERYSDADGDDDGMSDEGSASLVAFGEGAGSTVSGPTYTRGTGGRPGIRSEGSVGSAGVATGAVGERERLRGLDSLVASQGDDGASASSGLVDTTGKSPVPIGHRAMGSGSGSGVGSGLGGAGGVETAERILRDRLDDPGKGQGPAMGTPEEAGLGKFYFEDKK